jgi:hypothetical protein
VKYRTFTVVRAVVIAVAFVAISMQVYRSATRSSGTSPAISAPADAPAASDANPQNGNAPAAPGPSSPADPTALTDAEQEILRLQSSPITNGVSDPKNGTRRWVVDEPGFHAEFRSDTAKGSAYWNRVKIDWNGNGRFDEKWDFRPDGSVKRRVAPADDENYTEQYRLQGNRWLQSR